MARLIEALSGHEEVWEKLVRQSDAGRLPHALAFTGPAGIGKRGLAWAFAQKLLCDKDPSVAPCGECGPCRRVELHQSENVLCIEPQKGSIRLEASTQILEFLVLRLMGRARVIIIDGAQLLNPQAANSLLKVIEEPPAQTFFILTVPEISQLLPTLRSRVQVLRLSPLTALQLKAHSEGSVPEWLLNSARGSFEQLEAFRDPAAQEIRNQVFAFLSASIRGEREGLEEIFNVTRDREAALGVTRFLQQFLRDWSVLETGEIVHSDLKAGLVALPARASADRIKLWQKAFQMETDISANVDRHLIFENFFNEARAKA